jgi:hypothetical protein
MNRVLLLLAVIILIFTVDGFGQNRRQTPKRNFLPEVNDEVLVSARRKQAKHNRKKSRRKTVRGLTHDPEFEDWAHRNRKTKKIRRKNK